MCSPVRSPHSLVLKSSAAAPITFITPPQIATHVVPGHLYRLLCFPVPLDRSPVFAPWSTFHFVIFSVIFSELTITNKVKGLDYSLAVSSLGVLRPICCSMWSVGLPDPFVDSPGPFVPLISLPTPAIHPSTWFTRPTDPFVQSHFLVCQWNPHLCWCSERQPI
jgi:hypothetical protein